MEERLSSYKEENISLAKQKRETDSKLEALEEKYIGGKIEKELFEKHTEKYKNILHEIIVKTENPMFNSSNFNKAIFKGVEMTSNLSQLWISSDYNNKQLL